MMASAAIRAERLATSLHRHVRLYRIARRDGVVLALTEHSSPIEFDGLKYDPINSVAATAMQSRSGLGETSIEAQGAIDSDAITAEDLRAGRYRGAEITIYTVDFEFPWLGALDMSRQWIFGTERDDSRWVADCGGLGRLLGAKVGKKYEKTCDAELGDELCRVDIVPLSNYYEEVTSVTSARLFRLNTITVVRANGWFNYGSATWRTGANKGTTWRIELWDNATKEITTAQNMPFPIAVGDRVDLIVGCDRRASTCKLKFSNLVNFQGAPFLPSADEIIQPVTT